MSYGKIHRGFFDSSVNDTDPMTRLVFIGMIVLSDRQGRLDLTVEALARRLNLDAEVVRYALVVLGSPDAASRTPDHDGRRIVPLDPARSWGWLVVNKEQYRQGEVDDDAVRADARERKRRQRERERERDSDSSFTTKDSLDTKETLTLRDSHAPSRPVTPSHEMSREKRDAIFARCWSLVPRKEGRKDARRHFDAEVRRVTERCGTQAATDAALDRLAADLEAAVMNYAGQVASLKTEPRYVKLGSSLFFNFRDYVDGAPARGRKSERPEGLAGVAL